MVIRCYFGRYSHVDVCFERGKVVDVFRGVVTEKTRPDLICRWRDFKKMLDR